MNSNESNTVLEEFLYDVTKFGLPIKIRPVCSGENIQVWEHMATLYHGDTISVIAESSANNGWIERLWKDVHRSVALIKVMQMIFVILKLRVS